MKFLIKRDDSEILRQNLQYNRNAANNAKLKKLLLEEQCNFCAYTEKYIQSLDSTEVEHYDKSLKYKDDYYNYYTVIRQANLYKKDEKYEGHAILKNKFFQRKGEFETRIVYLKQGFYEVVDPVDKDAEALIDFLGFNHSDLYTDRKRHINRLRTLFNDAGYNNTLILEHFRIYSESLSFITAIEVEFSIDLSEFYPTV